MAYSSIAKPTVYFNTLLYTGTGSGGSDRQLTGVGFQPDWTWIKNRNSAQEHVLVDAVRGATKSLDSSSTTAEETNDTRVGAFISDGFQLGSGSLQNRVNGNGNGLVAWNWLGANGTASNSNGSTTSTVSANTTAGFSIVSWTGTGSATTLGHGLSAIPKWYIVKNRSTGSTQWRVYHASLGATKHMALDATQAVGTASSVFNNTEPTSSVFSVGTDTAANNSGDSLIAYVFAEKKGYSKFGKYTGNGNEDGTFIYTGFKPAWVMNKRTDTTNNWIIQDSKRNGFNADNPILKANTNDAEQAVHEMDFVSNGFKIKTTGAGSNASGGTYIFMAFAEAPFVTSGTKAAGTAR